MSVSRKPFRFAVLSAVVGKGRSKMNCGNLGYARALKGEKCIWYIERKHIRIKVMFGIRYFRKQEREIDITSLL